MEEAARAGCLHCFPPEGGTQGGGTRPVVGAGDHVVGNGVGEGVDLSAMNRPDRLHFEAMAQAKDILDAALKLEPAERARIAHEIIVSLDDEPADEGVEEAWEQELAKRAAEIDSGAVKVEPWSKVRQDPSPRRRY